VPVEKCRLITSTEPMTTWKTYQIPSTLNQAFEYLSYSPASSAIVAGGTDLLLDIQQERRMPVDVLVDVTRIPELTCLEIRGSRLFIGAAVPLKQISASQLVHEHAQALSESTGQIGGPQVRAVGTLGGNVGHALPAGDGAISLLTLDARAEVARADGLREVPMIDLYKGPGETALRVGQEILTGFYIPLRQPRQASAFSRVMRPQGVALPIINMAVWLAVDAAGAISGARIGVGPAGLVPQRALEVEQLLAGKVYSPELLQAAIPVLHHCIHFRSSALRATAGYRDHLAEVLLERVLSAAYGRAMSSSGGQA
jgi:xanthine dehydrogenase FAD-binding subunit